MKFIVFAIAYPLIWALSRLPMKILYIKSDVLYLFMYYIIGYRKKVVRENLSMALPHLTEEERRIVEKKFYSHMCDMFLEMIKTMSISKDEIEKRYVFKNLDVYKNLEKETEQPTGFHETGSLRLAYTNDDLEWFNYTKGILDIVGAPCSIIGTEEIHKYHPFIKLDGIKGAFLTPEDGYTDPTSTTNAMAKGARNGGAKIYRKNRN